MEAVRAGVYHIKFPLSRRGAMFAYHHSRDEDDIVALKMPPLRCLLCYDYDAENLGVSGGCYGAHGGFSGLPVKSQSVPQDLSGISGSMSSLSTNASYGGAHESSQSSSFKPMGRASQCSVPKDMHLMGRSTTSPTLARSSRQQVVPDSQVSDQNRDSNGSGNSMNGNRSSRQVNLFSNATPESRARFQIAQSSYEHELCFHCASAQKPHPNIIRSSTRQLYMSVPAHWEDGEKPAIVMEVAQASLQHWMLFLTHVEDRSSQDFYASRVRKWALNASENSFKNSSCTANDNHTSTSREGAAAEKGPRLWARVRLEVAKHVVRCLIEGLRHIHFNLRFSHNKIRAPHVLLMIEERDPGAAGHDGLGAGMSSRCTGSAVGRRALQSSADALSMKLAGFSGAEQFPSLHSSSDDVVNAMQASDLGFSCDMELYQQCANGDQIRQSAGLAAEIQKMQEKVRGDLSACGKLLQDLNQDRFLAQPDPQLAHIACLLRGSDDVYVTSKDDHSPKLEANEAGNSAADTRSVRSPSKGKSPETSTASLNITEKALPVWPEGLDEAVNSFLSKTHGLQDERECQPNGRDDFEREVEVKLQEVMEYLKAWVRWRERPDKHEYHQGRPTVKTIKLEERTILKSIGAFFKGVLGGGRAT